MNRRGKWLGLVLPSYKEDFAMIFLMPPLQQDHLKKKKEGTSFACYTGDSKLVES